MAGTVGAIFNGALQLGSAVGISAVSSIETSVEEKNGNPASYAGRAAAYWFMLGIIGVEIISLSVFYKVEAEHQRHHDEPGERDSEKSRRSTSADPKSDINEEVVDPGMDRDEELEDDDRKFGRTKGNIEQVREDSIV